MLGTKYLPHSGTQCYSFTSYLFYIVSYAIKLSIMQITQIKTAPAPTGTVSDALRKDTPRLNNIVSFSVTGGNRPSVIFILIFKKGWYKLWQPQRNYPQEHTAA